MNMMQLKSIDSLKVCCNYRVLVKFTSGERMSICLRDIIFTNPAFIPLRNNPALFAKAKIEPGGYAISWGEDMDLSVEYIFTHGKNVMEYDEETTGMENLQVDVSTETLKEVEPILNLLGLDIDTAIRIFLRQVVLTKSIPFPIQLPRFYEEE